MTIGAALKEFYSGFSIPAYPKTSVPDNATMPYIVYDVIESTFDRGPVSQTVQIWYKTTSEATPSAKAKAIKDTLKNGGVKLAIDDGFIWLRLGSPWCLNSNTQDDNSIKLRQLNITLEYLVL